MRAIWMSSLAVLVLALGFSGAGIAGEPKSSAKAKAVAVQPIDLTTKKNFCGTGTRQSPKCLEQHVKDPSACPCDLVVSPDPGARKVKSGTIKLECPAGTDKLCNGNDCGCWTRNE